MLKISSLRSRREEANERFSVYLSSFLLHFPPITPQRDSTITSRLSNNNYILAQLPEQNVLIFSLVYPVKLSTKLVYNRFPVFLMQHCYVSLLFTVFI